MQNLLKKMNLKSGQFHNYSVNLKPFTNYEALMDDNQLWKMAKARVEFKAHLRKYLLVNGFLWLLWLMVNIAGKSGAAWSFPWPIYVSLAWGLALAIHYYKAYGRKGIDPIRREYEKLKKSKSDDLNKPL